MIKPKPHPKRIVALRDRVHASARRHPIVTLATLATVIGLLVSVGPTITLAIHYYETREHAALTEANLRELVHQVQIGEARNLAWAAVQSTRTEISMKQNRVNDCEIREQKRESMSQLERQTCSEYRAALADAIQRFNSARNTALELSK